MNIENKSIEEKIHHNIWLHSTIEEILMKKDKDRTIATKVNDKVLSIFPRETDVCILILSILLGIEDKEIIEVQMAKYILLTPNHYNQSKGLLPNPRDILSNENKRVYLGVLIDFVIKNKQLDSTIEYFRGLIKWCKL